MNSNLNNLFIVALFLFLKKVLFSRLRTSVSNGKGFLIVKIFPVKFIGNATRRSAEFLNNNGEIRND